jgi:uncharacterized RDD family membrane protein YckC
MPSANPLDTTIAVVTPENIAFEYQLAGPFRRLPAYLIDIAVSFGVIVAVGLTLLLVGLATQFSIPPAFLSASMMIGYFLISWFYGTFMETYFNGRTVGKWACGLRVICVDGRPIDGTRAVIRNLLRGADLFPYAALSQFDPSIPPVFLIPTGIVGLVCTICTRRMQRLGDMAAGTMVVIDERSWRLPVTKVEDPRAAALASFIPGDYRVSRSMARTLATYVERRAYLTPGRRREVARGLTDPLLQRFEFRPDIDPDLMMISLYHATFIADPRDAPPDLGPLAGHSPLAKDFQKANSNTSKDLAANAPHTPSPRGSGNIVALSQESAESLEDEPLVTAEIIDDIRPSTASPGGTP